MDKPSRTQRREAARKRSRVLATVAIVAGLVAVAAGVGFALTSPGDADTGIVATAESTAPVALTFEETSTLGSVAPALEVEVPDLVGRALEDAERLLGYAGFVPHRIEATSVPQGAVAGTVVRQEPEAGILVMEGSDIQLYYAPEAGGTSDEQAASAEHFVVVIDPGHQAVSNLELEPIGPGSADMKEKVRGGATGVSTRIPEYETVLQISLLLREELEKHDIEVVMTRTGNDVDISNRERAEVANEAGADLFIRVHCDGAGDPDVHGASTLYPSGNAWVAPIETRSREAAEIIQAKLVARTGAADRGITGRSDITGFNWSKVPSVIVECGFLSNPAEDKLLSGADYRQEVAKGLANGIRTYLDER